MYQFTRSKVLPIFLERRIPIKQLAKEAGVSEKTAEKAVNGLPITAVVVARIADALGVAPLDVLVERR
ncbi:MAG: helix-turn-helix domain-containing protein [Selenomonadaceae bacterium]|nr:helix-turn-helix domain-containing protein [Selenomonadaceae bacterium]